MMRIIALCLKSITYSGNPIGNDIYAEMESAGQSAKVDAKIKRGDNAEINQEIAYFETIEHTLAVPLRIQITENDILFDDIGEKNGAITIDLAAPLPQSHIFEIKVAESRGGRGRRVALFHITIEASPAIRYVADTDDKGWLEVVLKNADAEKHISLPIHLKVLLEDKDEHREHFTIAEGALKNIRASVALGDNGESRFSKTNPHTKSAKLTYSISKKILTIGRKRYTTVDYPNAMWTKGIYDIKIPDYPHAGGNVYPNNKHATTWFRIYHPEDRYLHTGERSLGCITVTENNRWDELYTLLIASRKGDDKNIGTVKVID